MEQKKCILCEEETIRDSSLLSVGIDSHYYECNYCGKYIIDGLSISTSATFQNKEKKFKIACVLNERRLKDLPGVALDEKTDLGNPVCGLPRISENELLDSFPKNANEILNRTLLNLSRMVLPSQPFSEIPLDNKQNQLNSFTEDWNVCKNLLKELSENGLIRFTGTGGIPIIIKSKGWETIEKLKTTNIESKQAFVAMWFNNFMDDFYDNGIYKAIKEAGYNPFKINSKDFNGKICDEIIAEIRRSKFLIADFTGRRGGVYFEAGFAHGLGREVIFTVNERCIKKLHFDTRQYNHIVYNSPEDLYKQLLNRIRATII
jgi:hypothetical protein